MQQIIRNNWKGTVGLLSPRELEFTLHVAAGLTDKQIARQVGLAPDSVRKRIYNAMFKLGASRRPQLIAEAMRRAIITPLALVMAVMCISASMTDGNQDTERAHRTAKHTRVRPGGRREDLLNNLFQV